jgi:TP901 family phage tail tape measure protein
MEVKPARRQVQTAATFSNALDRALASAQREIKQQDAARARATKAAEREAKAAERRAMSFDDIARRQEVEARAMRRARSRARATMGPDDSLPTRSSSRGGRGGVELGANLAIAGQEFEQLGAKTEQGLRSSYEAFRDYETAIAEVTTVTSTMSEDQIKKITGASLAAYGGKPVDQVRAFYEVVSAGAMDEKSATEQLDAANKLAVGGRADVAVAVQALSKGVANFSSKGETAATVADSLFVAVQLGNARVEEMARALPNVASAASQAGLTLDETNSSLAVLSKRMGTVQIGSNALQQALSNIQKPTKGARKEAKRMGIDFSVAGVQAAGSWDKFIDTIADNPKFDENTLAKLFDSSEARSAIGNLIDGNKDLEATMVAMSKKEGAAAAATARMMDTTAQRAALVEAKFGLLKIQAGEALVPALTELAQELGPVIEGTTLWMKENGDTAAIIAKYALGITIASKALGVLFSATSMISSITGLAGGAMSSMGGTMDSVGGKATANAGKIGKLGAAVGSANLVFAAAAVAILAFEVALQRAGQTVEAEHDRLDQLNKSTEEGGLGVSFTKKNEKGETVEKTENELLMERRNRLVADVNAKAKQAQNAGTGAASDNLGGKVLQGWGAIINKTTGVSDDLDRQKLQADLDLARFDRQYGGQLGLSEEQRHTSADIYGGVLTGEGSAFAEMVALMKQQNDLSQKIASNTAAGGNGPSMEAGLT